MTPTASIVSRVTEQKTVEDETGRRLTVRRLTALDTLRLFKAAGPTLSQNQQWLGVASLAIAVTAIDGIPVPTPINEPQIEAVVARLGEGGLSAVADAFESDSIQDSESKTERAGNLPGTLT
jgi:hypothetical protein